MFIWLIQETRTEEGVSTNYYRAARNLWRIKHYIDKYRYYWYDEWGYDAEDLVIDPRVQNFFADLENLESVAGSSEFTGEAVLAECDYNGISIQIRIIFLKVYED
jgi:hypothetical protein